MPTKVAVCHVPDIRADIENSFTWIKQFAKQAEERKASIVCFPECFLQGYLTDKCLANEYALNLKSFTFKILLNQLTMYDPTIIFGLIEEEDENLYNTAVVIKNGELLGRYRKTHLLDGERIFTAGSEYPVFQIDRLKFGVNICYDTQFPDATENIARQGASLIFCPANNMMRYEMAEKYKHLHHKIRIERAVENKVWLMSSDVTGERDGRISYGPTSAINPAGRVVSQVPLMETGMITVDM